MALTSRRPLPSPPHMGNSHNQPGFGADPAMYRPTNPYLSAQAYPPFTPIGPTAYDEPTTTSVLRGGMLLHKGFYDLLAMIPTPSASRFLWGAPSPPVAGPRYEDLPTTPTNVVKPTQLPPPVGPVTPRKTRRISKDMVSNPTGFMYDYFIVLCFSFSNP